MSASLVALLLALALFAVLFANEVRRVAAPTVLSPRRPTQRGRSVPLWAELLLWAVTAALVGPRVIGLLT